MTPQQVDLVQSSFAKVAPIAETAAGLFYNRLFEIAPQTKSLFHVDMAEQGRKLMTTLGVVVNGLGKLDSILPAASFDDCVIHNVFPRRKSRAQSHKKAALANRNPVSVCDWK